MGSGAGSEGRGPDHRWAHAATHSAGSAERTEAANAREGRALGDENGRDGRPDRRDQDRGARGAERGSEGPVAQVGEAAPGESSGRAVQEGLAMATARNPMNDVVLETERLVLRRMSMEDVP